MASDFSRDEIMAVARRHAAEITEISEREAAKAVARHAEVHAHLAGHLDALDVWLRRKETRRPRLSPDDIAAAAVRLADAEGLEAVSMRRLAADLGVGTMSLYHYVRTKDELLTLVTDHVLGEVTLPPGERLPERWQDAVRVVARRSLAALRGHPWVLDISDDPAFGPNGVRHFDESLAAVASLPGTTSDRLDLLAAVDEFVFGFATKERINFQGGAEASPELLGYLETLLSGGDHPALQALVGEYGLGGAWKLVAGHGRDPARFERQLDRLIAGFESR